MDFRLTFEPQRPGGEVLILPVAETSKPFRPHPLFEWSDEKLSGLLSRASVQEGFEGKSEQTFVLHTHGKIKPDRIALVGLGPAEKIDPEDLRRAAGRAAKLARGLKARSLSLVLPTELKADEAARAAVEGILLGGYRFDRYLTSDRKDGPSLSKVELVAGALSLQADEGMAGEAIALGRAVGEATNWARDLVNEPAAVITPERLAAEAQAIARRHRLAIDVRGRKEIEKLRMGMFLGVAQGSALEPKLVKVSYIPKDPASARRPCLALVGKAITFDSGGLSLKTAEGMVEMKTDMAGAAAVLAAMQVIAYLRPPFPVHAFLGACENMPSGTAYRPGDILISRLGKTVEVTNTDAEGRLVLGDVLAWANELNPSAIVDLATLTGACIVALGHSTTGVFGVDDRLVNQVLESGKRAGEDLWRLPISEGQKDALKSEVADMKNSGERPGAAINAAHFLKHFVGQTPWVHLDIAGPSISAKEKGYFSKGATGVGVRTLIELVRSRTGELESAPSKVIRLPTAIRPAARGGASRRSAPRSH